MEPRKSEEHFQKELKRLQRHNPNAPDYNVQRNYLDFFTDLPWNNYSKDIFDIPKAEKVLNKDHFGLEDIKKRILEHMAVLKLKNNMKSPILCLVWPSWKLAKLPSENLLQMLWAENMLE